MSDFPQGRPRGPDLDPHQLEVLQFAASQRLIIAAQAQALTGCSAAIAQARLRHLVRLGLIDYHRVFHREAGAYSVTSSGLRRLDETIAPPRLDLGAYTHDLGVAWVSLAARRGAFGELSEVISEREMRSRDTVLRSNLLRPPEARMAIRLGGVGPRGYERLHYPDLVLVTTAGRRIAVELELTAKGRARREKIMLGYAGAGRIDGVLYLVDRPQIARSIETSARAVKIGQMVHVQPFRWSGRAPGTAAQTPQRSAARTRPVEAGGRAR